MKVLLASHAYMAKGVKSSVELILGKQDKLYEISAYVDEQIPFEQEIKKFLAQNTTEKLVIISDILGGSVNNELVNLLRDADNTILISGMNLSLVIGILLLDEKELDKNIENVIEEARKGITNCSNLMNVDESGLLTDDF